MRRIGTSHPEGLFGADATRAIEVALASQLPPFELMSRAGAGVARLAQALAPHARSIWIACGPGNNGGDGLVAARHLHGLSRAHHGAPDVVVTLCGNPSALPPDAARALSEALSSGVHLSSEPPECFDLGVDALLGIGAHEAPRSHISDHLARMHARGCPVLAVDLPSGLMADTGVYLGPASCRAQAPRHTLSLLTLKPGLFTGAGRDLAGSVWFDPLGVMPESTSPPDAFLFGNKACSTPPHAHSTHKGSRGDVVVIGGEDISVNGSGMTGAAVLAARAALHAGAGRVYVGLLGTAGHEAVRWDPQCPELMFRQVDALMQTRDPVRDATVVCGCGGGSGVRDVLPGILSSSQSLVLDADGLNRVAEDSMLQAMLRSRRSKGLITVLTPHPLEAARLLACTTAEVMSNRLAAAGKLSNIFEAICVLKGSGTVIAAPDGTPCINSSGNPALATAGTGDVLAGWIGALLAHGSQTPFRAVLSAVFAHGHHADVWAKHRRETLTAHRLAMGISGR